MLRTKLFLIAYFLPAWVASLLLWGDNRTSSAEFAAAPGWFYPLQWAIQASVIALLFLPPRPRDRPLIFGLFFSVVTVVSLYFSNPIIEAEYVLLSGSILITIVAVFLSIFKASVRFDGSDLGMLFCMFAAGFALQGFLYLQFGVVPSHSVEDVFVRFNGITNDSLATAFILPFFIPWAASGRYAAVKSLMLVAMAFGTGSLFAVAFVPPVTLGYLLYNRHFSAAAVVFVTLIAGAFFFYETIDRIFERKFLSMITHLSFFLDLSGMSYYKSVSCSVEFCESFVQSGFNLSPFYVIAFYGLLLCFIVPLFRTQQRPGTSKLELHTLRITGVAILAGSLVHPIPLIPLAVPLFLVLATVYASMATARPAPIRPVIADAEPVAFR